MSQVEPFDKAQANVRNISCAELMREKKQLNERKKRMCFAFNVLMKPSLSNVFASKWMRVRNEGKG